MPVNSDYSRSGRLAIQNLPILLKLGNNLLSSGRADNPGHECLPNSLVCRVRLGTQQDMCRVQQRVGLVVGTRFEYDESAGDVSGRREPGSAVCEGVF